MSTPTFRGHDWTELCIPLGVTQCDDERETAEAVRVALAQAVSGDRLTYARTVRIVRAFMAAIVATSTQIGCASAPLWVGLSNVTDDDMFMVHVSNMLHTIWT